MKARGRFLCALIALGIAVCSLPGLWIGVSAQSTALYAQSSRYSKQNQGREYVVSYTFDKAVGAAGKTSPRRRISSSSTAPRFPA